MSKKLTELKFHGGQSWANMKNYVEDFSVTTNCMGTPESGLNAIRETLTHIDHYPPSSNEPALSNMCKFVWRDETAKANKELIVLGNGSSEVIDLCIRMAKKAGCDSFRPGPMRVQYMDYQRCALTAGMTLKPHTDNTAKLMCIVNPTNPTGDFLEVSEIKKCIENKVPDDSWVIIDESMLFWHGPNWRNQSLTQQTKWIKHMHKTQNVKIFIVHSWTKIWTCCGLRIGTLICPSKDLANQIKANQTPWSVNLLALAFANAAVQDEDYLQNTWEYTPLWRAQFVSQMSELCPRWQIHGKPFLSWVWVDTKNAKVAEHVFNICEKKGVPIRWAKYGYHQPTFLRFAVRHPEKQQILFQAIESALEQFGYSISKRSGEMNSAKENETTANNDNEDEELILIS